MIDVDPVDLSVLIVNYNVGRFVLDAIGSVAAQRFVGPEGRPGRLEMLVIDNASHPADAAILDRLPASVTVIKNSTNLGFAAANNQGIVRAQGRYLCFLNPDTRLREGSLQAMLQYLYEHPGVGMVGPMIWADDEGVLRLPPGDPPSLLFLLSRAMGGVSPRFSLWRQRRWLRSAVRFWRAEAPMDTTMLSGACLMASRHVIEHVGRFDSGFFLYYEDSDLCRRIRGQGYRLVVVPAAQVVHYYNQSAKTDPAGAWCHAMASELRFVRIHYGRTGALIYRIAQDIGRRSGRGRQPVNRPDVIDLGALERPPRLSVPGAVVPERELLWQVGPDSGFAPSAGALRVGNGFDFNRIVWERLMPGRYFARAVDPKTLRPMAYWSWVKR
ncbi:putative Glycosyl transferase family 2 [Candidatus Methylomirabilis oxygeniifera]|uniref:Putative Glycosyl transferase family 2 n=1 Tax=Methylomirabilis oxygeniifera TaxID=671143 RepID=D5MIJ7_METO1|nr:putative Glycosyl transferase family 2 [Candidatus Methylomirabilis oxyfera]